MKIAVVGHGPLTRGLAPVGKDGWLTWGISHREWQREVLYGKVRGFDVLWECHDWRPESPEYQEFFDRHNVRRPDKAACSELVGAEGIKSSISWMIAEAILCKPDEISIYGCDSRVIQEKEYNKQIPNIKFLLGYAEGAGIKVSAPEQCGLFDSIIYGVENHNKSGFEQFVIDHGPAKKQAAF